MTVLEVTRVAFTVRDVRILEFRKGKRYVLLIFSLSRGCSCVEGGSGGSVNFEGG
jgi:hypothetical protein